MTTDVIIGMIQKYSADYSIVQVESWILYARERKSRGVFDTNFKKSIEVWVGQRIMSNGIIQRLGYEAFPLR